MDWGFGQGFGKNLEMVGRQYLGVHKLGNSQWETTTEQPRRTELHWVWYTDLEVERSFLRQYHKKVFMQHKTFFGLEPSVHSFEFNYYFSSGTTSSADLTTQRSPLTDTSVESGTNALSFMSSTAENFLQVSATSSFFLIKSLSFFRSHFIDCHHIWDFNQHDRIESH